MVIRYVTPPPTLPPYLLKRFYKSFTSDLVSWAKHEYNDMIIKLYLEGNNKKAQYLEKECTYLNFLAYSSGFRQILDVMTPDIWSHLDRKTRHILIDARNILVGVG